MGAPLSRAVSSKSRPTIRMPTAPSTFSIASACCSPPTTSPIARFHRSRRHHQPSASRRNGSSHRPILPESHGRMGAWVCGGMMEARMERANMQMTQVHKLDAQGAAMLTYEAELAERLADGVRLDALWTRPTTDLGYVIFETGDHFTEWYYTDRWYNIFEITSPDGTLKGWYCNVAAPADIGDDQLFCPDLVLDEDEFAAEPALDDATRDQALAGLAELRRLVAHRQGPFRRLHGAN